jgi:heterodisulfide reductase subunit A
VSRLYRDGDVLRVRGYDTLHDELVDLEADMVVLATAIRPQQGADRLSRRLSVSCGPSGFVNEAHPKLRPVETNTAGVFVAGACQGPRDIPDSVASASAAASKILDLLGRDELERDPSVARVDEAVCSGCFHCQEVCPYDAIEPFEIRDRRGELISVVARVNAGVCQGCGTCQATCPSKSVELDGFTDQQVFAAIGGMAW